MHVTGPPLMIPVVTFPPDPPEAEAEEFCGYNSGGILRVTLCVRLVSILCFSAKPF